MEYDGVTIYRTWLEQARLMFQNESQVSRAVLALLDYALYEKEPKESNTLIRAYILGLKKSIASQHTNYARTATLRKRNNNNNNNNNKNNNNTSREEEAKWKLINSTKFLNDETDKEVHHNPFAVHKDGKDGSKE